MSCYCDYEPADVWEEKRRTARKQWTCCECGESIDPGDEYLDIAWLSDGSWDHERMCECCEDDWKRMTDLGHCRLIGYLQDTIDDAYRARRAA